MSRPFFHSYCVFISILILAASYFHEAHAQPFAAFGKSAAPIPQLETSTLDGEPNLRFVDGELRLESDKFFGDDAVEPGGVFECFTGIGEPRPVINSPVERAADILSVKSTLFFLPSAGVLRIEIESAGPPVEDVTQFYDLFFYDPSGPTPAGPGAPIPDQVSTAIVSAFSINGTGASTVQVRDDQGVFQNANWGVQLFRDANKFIVDIFTGPSGLSLTDGVRMGVSSALQVAENEFVCDFSGIGYREEGDLQIPFAMQYLPLPERSASVEKTLVNTESIFPGDVATFNIKITNNGSQPINNLKVRDGAGIEVEFFDISPCTFDPRSGFLSRRSAVICRRPTLLTGETWEFQLTGKVKGARWGKTQVNDAYAEDAEGSLGSDGVWFELSPLPTALSMEEVAGAFKGAVVHDYYLNNQLIVNDLVSGTRELTEVMLLNLVGVLDIVEGSEPDNSAPLFSTEMSLLLGEEPDTRVSDAYSITLVPTNTEVLFPVIYGDFQFASPDPASATFAVVHVGGDGPDLNVSTLAPDVAIADGLSFGNGSPYISVSPGNVNVHVATVDQAVSDVFSFSAEAGRSYLGFASKTDGATPQIILSVSEPDGTSVETTVTTANEGASETPDSYVLGANYPNPFNPETTISFEIPNAGYVSLSIFDVQGRHVATLVDGMTPVGSHEIMFDASTLSSGLYFYVLDTGGVRKIRAMTVLK